MDLIVRFNNSRDNIEDASAPQTETSHDVAPHGVDEKVFLPRIFRTHQPSRKYSARLALIPTLMLLSERTTGHNAAAVCVRAPEKKVQKYVNSSSDTDRKRVRRYGASAENNNGRPHLVHGVENSPTGPDCE